ncbi:hypothetical protein M3610_09550 [Neobacillus sp. MER 74]|uniref:hypothetical protein n=1 Tax=Neobacillus sp. MER 74 TaxID=2939566 RepID=UPI0020411EFA|nr:hypothetical protein [Neobacillus sp. MER 74]MCM3115530.1 hypothetical protein [Neobacillus sp. MER 74]
MKERLIARKCEKSTAMVNERELDYPQKEKSAAPVNERALDCPQKGKKCRAGK